MDYFITLNEKSIDAIGEAVEKPITVIDGLKETIAEKDETIAQKDETIAAKDERIAELEASVMTKIAIRIRANNPTGSAITGQAPTFAERSTGSIIPPTIGISSYSIPANTTSSAGELVQTSMLLKNGTGVIDIGHNFLSYSVKTTSNCSATIAGGKITISDVVNVSTRCEVVLEHN